MVREGLFEEVTLKQRPVVILKLELKWTSCSHPRFADEEVGAARIKLWPKISQLDRNLLLIQNSEGIFTRATGSSWRQTGVGQGVFLSREVFEVSFKGYQNLPFQFILF